MNIKSRLGCLLIAGLILAIPVTANAIEPVDETFLPSIEQYLYPIVIDPDGEFAYAASGPGTLGGGADDPVRGLIVKFDLATFERVDAIYIDTDFSSAFRYFQTGVIDPEGRYAYFANALVTPAQIVKIDLETFEMVDSLHTSFEEKDYMHSVIDPQGEFAYFGTANGRMVKVDLNTFERADGLLLDEERIRSLAIDPSGEFMYIGTEDIVRDNRPPDPGKIFKLDLATFETVDSFELDGLNAYAAAMHPSGEVAYFRVDGQLLTIDLATFEPVDSTSIGNYFNLFGRPDSLIIDPSGGHLFIREDGNSISRFNLDTKEKTDSISDLSRAYRVDPTREAIYTATEDGLVKVDASSFERVDLAEVDEGFVALASAAIDPAGEFGYFGGNSYVQNSRVAKVDLESMKMVDSITLDGKTRRFNGAIIDPAGDFAYFTRPASPGNVAKLNLETFEWEGYLEFEGVPALLTAVMGPDGKYAYFGSGGGPAKVVRLDLETFQPAGTIDLEAGEDTLFASAVDPAGDYAYFGAGWFGKKLVKIDLETFTRVDALEIENPSFTSGVIDPAGEYGYFASGNLMKLDLATFEWVDSINIGGILLMDPAGRYIYRSHGVPPRMSRVDLETFSNVETVWMPGNDGFGEFGEGGIIDPAGKFAWFGVTAGRDSEPARVVKIALLRSAEMQHSAVAINGGTPEPFAFSEVGDVIDYSFAVESDGNVTLTGVTVSEPQLDPLDCDPAAPATLAPGDSMVCTGSYTVTQADLDAGSFPTLATTEIAKTDPLNAEETVMADQNPAMAVTGTITDGDGYQAVGETISYLLTATNAGNVTLSDVAISNPDGVFSDCDAVPDDVLAPDESASCEGSHTVTQEDIDAGSFSVATTASATDPDASPVDGSGSATATAVRAAELGLDKQVTGGDPYSAVGDTIEYSLTATNTGNVTLTEVGISDPDAILGECNPAPGATLAPGETLTCQAGHTVTQADLDAGSFTNTAKAAGTDPDTNVVETADSTTASADQNPVLALSKEADVDEFRSPGDVIEYTMTASNDGNVGLTGVTVADSLLDSLDCAPVLPAEIGPGGQVVCTGSYTATESDVDAGSIVNTATADSDQTDPVEATATIALNLDPAISLVPDSLDFGDVAINEGNDSRTLTLENTGNGDAHIDTISEPGAPYALTGGTCLPTPTTVASHTTCTVIVAFVPDQEGHFSESLEIRSDAPSSPDTISLAGTGIWIVHSVPADSHRALVFLAILLGLLGWLAIIRTRRVSGAPWPDQTAKNR